jgi:hypothetical protein
MPRTPHSALSCRHACLDGVMPTGVALSSIKLRDFEVPQLQTGRLYSTKAARIEIGDLVLPFKGRDPGSGLYGE